MKLAIIGGGAAGMLAAQRAAQDSRWQVTIYEKEPRLGKKLLATGSGRCNLTNRYAAVEHYHGSDPAFVAQALAKYDPQAVQEIFAALGVDLIQEDHGRLFPRAAQAAAVLDNLRLALQAAGAAEVCDCLIKKIVPQKRGFRLYAADGRSFSADRVIIACGGAAAPSLGGSMAAYEPAQSLGHSLLAPQEAIVQLKSDFSALKALSGQKFNGTATLYIDGQARRTEEGEILFTDYGLSGLPILQLSTPAVAALAQKRTVTVGLNLAHEYDCEQWHSVLAHRLQRRQNYTLEDLFVGFWPKRIAQQLCKSALNCKLSRPCHDLSAAEIARLADLAQDWRFEISGSMGLKNAQATAGGIATEEIDAATMQSRLALGVYFCGEVVDIVGDCGGFNLQWAWSSALLAAENATMLTE